MSHHGRRERDPLGQALDAWRATDGGGEELSGTCRDRILRESSRPAAEPPLASLFLPFRQWITAAVVPMALAGILGFAFWSEDVSDPAVLGGEIASVQVHRQGGDVVFVIDNGGAPHRVVRSTGPEGEDAETLPGSGRVFRDSLHGGPNIVFYRIE
jgi:hypothetical protein